MQHIYYAHSAIPYIINGNIHTCV